MTYSDFVIWLEGYLEGCRTDLTEQQKVISKKIKSLRDSHKSDSIFLSGLTLENKPSAKVVGINGNWKTEVFNANGSVDSDT